MKFISKQAKEKSKTVNNNQEKCSFVSVSSQ